MCKVAILYICTGAYTVFWKDFYVSAEKYLLPDCEKHYFVFTDTSKIYGEKENLCVHRCEQEAYRWPFATLRRFEIFLKQEQQLKKFDYIFFFNANAEIQCTISKEMFLPRKEKGEKLLFVQHPGYFDKPNYEFTYDRNPHSKAFIPYGFGKYYVCGGVNGGEADAFLKLCHELDRRIKVDLSHNVIARFHDESQINRYIMHRKDYRILQPSFCYPEDWNFLPFPCIVLIRTKAKYINVSALRKDTQETKLSPFVEKSNDFCFRVTCWIYTRLQRINRWRKKIIGKAK